MESKQLPKIALGAWAWGNDGTFGGKLTDADLRPVFDAAMKAGLNLWDTAYAYGMGTSEKILGEFLRTVAISSPISSHPSARIPMRRTQSLPCMKPVPNCWGLTTWISTGFITR